MNTRSVDLFLSDEVQTLLDDFAALLDVRVTLFSLTGERLRRGKAMRNCEFCRILQEDMGKLDRCLSLDQLKQSEAAEYHDVSLYRCHAGLYEGIAPICVHGKTAGFLMIGQFTLDEAKMPEWIDGIEDEKKREEMRRAYLELPSFSQEKMDGILGLFKTLIDYIAVRELAVVQDDRLRQEIDRYIEKHATGAIRLPEMAKKLRRSVSTISQFLRRNYHTNFKDLVIEYRLTQAERFWKAHPDASVAEAAFAAGFSDQFYFSRVFRKRRGVPPGVFRAQFRGRR
ncbi:MAG: PocR ligand-binding domain-containing protein [Victivallaceae bacterium]|nr:PocR ligand-binding domain-containing protein [Victivallaceae bacterium]